MLFWHCPKTRGWTKDWVGSQKPNWKNINCKVFWIFIQNYNYFLITEECLAVLLFSHLGRQAQCFWKILEQLEPRRVAVPYLFFLVGKIEWLHSSSAPRCATRDSFENHSACSSDNTSKLAASEENKEFEIFIQRATRQKRAGVAVHLF